MSAAKPAAALSKLSMRVTRMEDGTRIALVNASGGLVTYFDGTIERAEAIVTAHNAFPQLVAALRECVRAYDTTGGAKGLAQQTAAEGARVLLRSLGEVE